MRSISFLQQRSKGRFELVPDHPAGMEEGNSGSLVDQTQVGIEVTPYDSSFASLVVSFRDGRDRGATGSPESDACGRSLCRGYLLTRKRRKKWLKVCESTTPSLNGSCGQSPPERLFALDLQPAASRRTSSSRQRPSRQTSQAQA